VDLRKRKARDHGRAEVRQEPAGSVAGLVLPALNTSGRLDLAPDAYVPAREKARAAREPEVVPARECTELSRASVDSPEPARVEAGLATQERSLAQEQAKANAMAKLKAHAMAKLKANAMAKLKAHAMAKVKAHAMAKLKANAMAKLKAHAMAKLKANAMAKLKAHAMAKVKAHAMAKVVAPEPESATAPNWSKPDWEAAPLLRVEVNHHRCLALPHPRWWPMRRRHWQPTWPGLYQSGLYQSFYFHCWPWLTVVFRIRREPVGKRHEDAGSGQRTRELDWRAAPSTW
jgi:hypothetical protein